MLHQINQRGKTRTNQNNTMNHAAAAFQKFQQWAADLFFQTNPIFNIRYIDDAKRRDFMLKKNVGFSGIETYYIYGVIIGECWGVGDEIITYREGEAFFSLYKSYDGKIKDSKNPEFSWDLVEGGTFWAGQEEETRKFYYFPTLESFLKSCATAE